MALFIGISGKGNMMYSVYAVDGCNFRHKFSYIRMQNDVSFYYGHQDPWPMKNQIGLQLSASLAGMRNRSYLFPCQVIIINSFFWNHHQFDRGILHTFCGEISQWRAARTILYLLHSSVCKMRLGLFRVPSFPCARVPIQWLSLLVHLP